MKASLKSPTLYSVEGANRTLPLVKRIVSDIVAISDELDARQFKLDALGGGPAELQAGTIDFEEWERIQEEIDLAEDRMEEFAEELAALGVELQDATIGEVDFPTRINGREAFLCWRLGEPEVAHWHAEDAGFESRRSLSDASEGFPLSGNPNF